MKSTGEAIGYDDKLTRALYKALQATGAIVIISFAIFPIDISVNPAINNICSINIDTYKRALSFQYLYHCHSLKTFTTTSCV